MIIKLRNPAGILSSSAVGGKAEGAGPLGKKYDLIEINDRFGKRTWEQAEAEMQHLALFYALNKRGLKDTDLDGVFAGDLVNQCTSSTFGLLEYDTPLIGLYGACSTAAEAIGLASLFCDAGYGERFAAVTSSHFCSAERQFRFPLEYGAQRTPTSQHTVTGSGAFILAKNTQNAPDYCAKVTEVMFGKSVDSGISDANNMGAAMAPAAANSLCSYFLESGGKPDDFDKIVTGDLGYEGSSILRELMKTRGFPIGGNYEDCGLLVYDPLKQDMHAGASGCACSAVVLSLHYLPMLENGEISDMLFVGTGALLSASSVLQGLTIPSVAHLLRINGSERMKI